MRLGDMRDLQPLGFGGLDVLIRVPVGIDDHGLAGGLTADDVAGLREFGLEETFDEHPDIVRAWCPATSSSSNTPARATPAGRFRRTPAPYRGNCTGRLKPPRGAA